MYRNISSNGFVITFARLFLGFLFLVLFLTARKEIRKIKTSPFSFYLLATGILTAAAIICYTNAIKSTSLANAVFLLYLGPLLAVGIAAIYLKEKLTFLNVGLLCLAFLGFLFLLEFKFDLRGDDLLTYLWGVGSAICYALVIVGNRKIPVEVPALVRAFYQLLVGSITVFPFLGGSIFTIPTGDIYWLVAIGFFQGFFALSLMTLAVKLLKAVEYGTISYIEPLVASLVGFFVYSENMTPLQSIGCSIIFISGLAKIFAAKN